MYITNINISWYGGDIFMSVRNNELMLLWKQRIAARTASNLSIREWCSENNVSPSQYHYWIKKINKINSNEANPDEIQLVEVSLKAQKQKITIDNNQPIILHFHDCKIEIPKNFDKQTIAEVLSAIVSVC